MGDQSWASSPAVRRSMRSNTSRDTKPELELRRILHAAGLRYRVCDRPIPSIRRTADIVFRPAKVAVELRGCFWHGCPTHYRQPSTNSDYWGAKAQRNAARDADLERVLDENGWLLVVVWEHDDFVEAARAIEQIVRSRKAGG